MLTYALPVIEEIVYIIHQFIEVNKVFLSYVTVISVVVYMEAVCALKFFVPPGR